MANLELLAADVRNDGYSEVNAEAKACQNIERSRRMNWLGIKVTDAFAKITGFLENIS